MNPSVLNEVFQWASILGIFLVTVAAYRQLGLLVVDNRAYLTGSFGPSEEQKAGQRLLSIFPERKLASWNLAIFVQERCPICEVLLDDVRQWREGFGHSLQVALLFKGSEEFTSLLREKVPEASITPLRDVEQGREPPAYPFAVLIDQEGVVKKKSIGGDGSSIETLIRASLGESRGKEFQILEDSA